LLWPIDTKLAVWVAYIKTQLGIATEVSVIKLKVTKLAVWVAYIKTQLGIATQMSVIKVKVTVTENRNSVSAQ